MRIIVNTSNMVIGGGVQVALSFLEELKRIGRDRYFVFLSAPVASQLELASFPDRFAFYHFPVSPARLPSHRRVVRRLAALEREIGPDVVFTVFGPSYWRPRSPHVMGFALGWVINPDSVAFRSVGLRKRLENLLKKISARRDADFFIVETEEVERRLIRYLGVDASRIAVVGNTCNQVFEEEFDSYPIGAEPGCFNLVTICANYPHKNLKVIREVIPFLEAASFSCRFWLTIPPDQFERDFGHLSGWVSNLGSVPIRFCPSIYQQCDALFLPTLLESFTASYPEAMKMRRPILTSDLGFARTICGDAAEYFDPLNPGAIADAIIKVGSSAQRRQELVCSGAQRLKLFPSASERAGRYLEICRAVAGNIRGEV